MTVTDIEIAELGTEPVTQAERDALSGRGSSGGGGESDPWATEGPGGYSDTLPF
jgi:hypothetical protein